MPSSMLMVTVFSSPLGQQSIFLGFLEGHVWGGMGPGRRLSSRGSRCPFWLQLAGWCLVDVVVSKNVGGSLP